MRTQQPKLTILLADDEARLRQYCRQELAAWGARVLLAADGEDALDVLDTFTVDLVVLDAHMPRCSGLDTAKWVKQRHPDMPVILFTADEDCGLQLSPYVDAVVLKGADLRPLLAEVVRLAERPPVALP
jgi:DNA-binding response OmpR family regulator